MDILDQYYEHLVSLLLTLFEEEKPKIQMVGRHIAESTLKGGIIHTFGVGHSALPMEEVFIRAGTFCNIRPLTLDGFRLDLFENIPKVGETLMRGFDGQPGEVMIVFSNSGVNPLPIEVALESKKRGLYTVAVTSFAHSRAVLPKHESGMRLLEIADCAIDTHVPYRDAALTLSDYPYKMCPLSTIANITIIHAILAEAAEQIRLAGAHPPIRVSRNTPEGPEHNRQFVLKYGDRIPELRYH